MILIALRSPVIIITKFQFFMKLLSADKVDKETRKSKILAVGSKSKSKILHKIFDISLQNWVK